MSIFSGTGQIASIKDDGDSYEGIYRCAFLLYRLGNTSDIHTLWVAKHINMYVGTSKRLLRASYDTGRGLVAFSPVLTRVDCHVR